MPYAFPRGLNECVARVVLRGRGKRRGEEEVHARDIWEEHRGRKFTNKDAQCSGLERLPCFFPVALQKIGISKKAQTGKTPEAEFEGPWDPPVVAFSRPEFGREKK